MALSVGFRIPVSQLQSCYPSYGAPTITPVGLTPTERASLRWTHNVSDEYSAGIESLNIQAIVRPLTGVKPPVPRMTLNRPDLALNGRYVDLGMLYLWSCTTLSHVLAWKATSRPCRGFEKSFLDRNSWVSEIRSMAKRGSTRKISCGVASKTRRRAPLKERTRSGRWPQRSPLWGGPHGTDA
jgi:hypothetical protein